MSLSLCAVGWCGYPLPPRSIYVIKRAHHRSSGVSESKLTPLNLCWFPKNASKVRICARILACDKRLWKSPDSWLNEVRNALKHIRLAKLLFESENAKLEIMEMESGPSISAKSPLVPHPLVDLLIGLQLSLPRHLRSHWCHYLRCALSAVSTLKGTTCIYLTRVYLTYTLLTYTSLVIICLI